jgi:hypothetical protein
MIDALLLPVALVLPSAAFIYLYIYSPPDVKLYRRTLEALREEALARSDAEPFARIVYDTTTAVLEPRED